MALPIGDQKFNFDHLIEKMQVECMKRKASFQAQSKQYLAGEEVILASAGKRVARLVH